MIGLVDVPVEFVVVDEILAVVRRERRLRVDRTRSLNPANRRLNVSRLRVQLTRGCHDKACCGNQAGGSTARNAHAHGITS